MSNQQSSDDEVLVRVRFDVVYFWVAGHWGVRREDARLSLRSPAARMYVGKVDAPLLPARGDEVSTDEAQEAFAMPYRASHSTSFAAIHCCGAASPSLRFTLASRPRSALHSSARWAFG